MDTSNLFSHPEKHETMPAEKRSAEPVAGPIFSDRPHSQQRADKRQDDLQGGKLGSDHASSSRAKISSSSIVP